MSYNDDELTEEKSFRASDEDMDDPLEPLEEPVDLDFGEEDPEDRYH